MEDFMKVIEVLHEDVDFDSSIYSFGK